ncbi:MAG: hypothetical protein ACXABK_00365 [Candidatus Heimdallarchaeaceae archaeon]|jgi:tRNA pseudouridine-54 N-methylase
MSLYYFAFNAPSLTFDKSDLYNSEFQADSSYTFVKAIADSFFLSNQFRKNLLLYYCTSYNSKPYVVKFDGNSLRYLGPSFFSAAHLLLRTKDHIINPNTKAGKLTSGLSVFEGTTEWVLEKYAENKKILITNSRKKDENINIASSSTSVLFLFGFNELLEEEVTVISWGSLRIDEQVILTNHYLES